MKPTLLHAKIKLPRKFSAHPDGGKILREFDIRIGTSRLRLKLLVFKNRADLREFWGRAVSGGKLGNHCDGVVNNLRVHVQTIAANGEVERERIEVDRRYFAVMGIVKRRLASAEVGAHEAVHAAFAYAKRVNKTPWDAEAKSYDEEAIAYPTGKIAAEIADVYWKHFDDERGSK